MDPAARTLAWVRDFVVGLDLCPFAAGPLARGEVRVAVVDDEAFDDCVRATLAELVHLDEDPSTETTLVVFSRGLAGLDALLDAAAAVEQLVEDAGFSGLVQVVSFHPEYRFEGALADDPANATNRSPYPMLHLLREASVTDAVSAHPDPEGIPARNAEKLRSR